MRTIVEFRRDAVARTAGAVAGLFGRILRVWVATLDHEAPHDAMKRGAVVKAFAREFLEIRDCPRRHFGPELDDHFAVAGFEHGHFLLICIHGFLFFRFVGLLAANIRQAKRADEQAAEQRWFHLRPVTWMAHRCIRFFREQIWP
jgi:hypothetical protein